MRPAMKEVVSSKIQMNSSTSVATSTLTEPASLRLAIRKIGIAVLRARTARSNEAYAQDRQDVETTRASQTEEALAAQYGAQSGAVAVWSAQVNSAADTQAQMAGRAATESTSLLGLLDACARGGRTTLRATLG